LSSVSAVTDAGDGSSNDPAAAVSSTKIGKQTLFHICRWLILYDFNYFVPDFGTCDAVSAFIKTTHLLMIRAFCYIYVVKNI
jgi:hypothetical protein